MTRRESVRPQSPPIVQRMLMLGVVLFAFASLVTLREITTSDWAPGPETIALAHLRNDAESLQRQQAATEAPGEDSAPTLRDFYKEMSSVLNADQSQVVAMAKHAWQAYRHFAHQSDVLNVVNGTGETLRGHDMAYTLVDSLDTLFIMGLHREFDEVSKWMKTHLLGRLIQPGRVSVVDTTVRSLGGLLSAAYLSGELHLLELAVALGQALESAFTCGVFIPCREVDLELKTASGIPLLSEASSFLLEYTYLAELTGERNYLRYVDNLNTITSELVRDFFPDGLLPVRVNWETLQGVSSNTSFGAYGDVYYEYLLKQWLLTGKKDEEMKKSYLTAIEGLKTNMTGYSHPSKAKFIGLVNAKGKLERRMDHLTCFVPGMLALGVLHGLPQDHLKLAKELMETCMQMYLRSKSKLAPEILRFCDSSPNSKLKNEFRVDPKEDYNLLRPETVESLMILYRVTKDEKYRVYGRIIMTAIEEHSKVATGGYRSTQHVFLGGVTTYGLTMESSFLSETLKYLFLLFSDDDILPLDTVVFNTGAHPFPVFTP